MPVSILRVCWNRSSIASLAHERPDEGRSSKNQTEKQYPRLILSIQSSGAHKFDYLIAMPVSASKVGWNWSSTASLEGKIIDGGRKWRFSLSCYLYYAFSFVWLFYSMQRREYWLKGCAGIARRLLPRRLWIWRWNCWWRKSQNMKCKVKLIYQKLEFKYLIVMPVSTSRVRWNRSSMASLEGKRSDEGQSTWNQMEKYMRFILSCMTRVAWPELTKKH